MENHLENLIRSASEKLDSEEKNLLQVENAETQSVAERISRIQLCQRMIRNIRMTLLAEDTSGLQMRINQIHAVHELICFLQNEGGENFKGRFKQPTGAGKTVLFGVIIKLIGVKTLVLVPRQNLLSNTKKEFVEMVGISESEIGLVGAGSVDFGKTITIATYQSHVKRMKNDAAYRKAIQACDLIVCDEAHRSLGDATQSSINSIDEAEVASVRADEEEVTAEEERIEETVLSDLDQSTNRQSLKLAFTATPTLSNKDVADHFPYLIAEEKQGDLVKAGILVGYKIVQVHASCETDDFEGYLTEDEEAEVLERENVYGKLTHAYAEALQRYQVKQLETDYPLHGIAFCVNIKECDKFAAEAKKYGLRSAIVTSREAKGKKGDAVIAEAEQALVNREIDLIITVNKLGEGWNFKPANAAIWARASTSPMVVIQGVGRTCRSHTDDLGRVKPHSLVFETQWSLRRGYGRRNENNRLEKKPLTIAQALMLNGEDPTQVCSMENNQPLYLEKYETLNDEGTASIEGVEYVEICRYLCHKLPFLTDYTARSLVQFYPKIKPVKPAHPVVLRGRIQTCYLKSEIDQILSEAFYVHPDGIAQPIESRDQSEEMAAVYVRAYLEGKVGDHKKWLAHAEELGLKVVDDRFAFYRGGAGQKLLKVDLHAKHDVDEMLENLHIPEAEKANKEDLGEGIEIADEQNVKRIAFSVKHSPLVSSPIYDDLMLEIEKRGIKPVSKTIISGNGRPIVMYWKDEVEPLIQRVTEERERKRIQKEREAAEERQRSIIEIDQRRVAEKAAKTVSKQQFWKENTYHEITPLGTPGLYHVKYGFVDNNKPIKREGDVVQIDEYISPLLGRKLTWEEQRIVTNKLGTIPKMIYYWQHAIDGRIETMILKKN